MRECFYLLGLTYHLLPYSGSLNLRRDLSATLFGLADAEFKKRTGVFSANWTGGNNGNGDSYGY